MITQEDRDCLGQSFNRLIAKFNWDQVQTTMSAVDWKWFISSDKCGIPSVAEMVTTVKSMFDKALDNMETDNRAEITIHQSGFTLELGMLHHYVKLDFVVSSSMSFDGFDD